MECLHTPNEWCRLRQVHIVDADGWRGSDGRDWTDPIDEAEFKRRAIRCTVRYDDTARAYFGVTA